MITRILSGMEKRGANSRILHRIAYSGLFVILVTGVFGDCEYPVDGYQQVEKKTFLIINADLSDSYGKISVAYSIDSLSQYNGYAPPPTVTATAYVVDGHGNKHTFVNNKVDSTFNGVVGETYQLFVTANGENYQSTVETMPKCPEIDSLTATFRLDPDLPTNDILRNAFDVRAQLKDFPEPGNYYQWDWISYYRVTFCSTAKERNGYIAGVPCSSDCWGIIYNPLLEVFSDNLSNGKSLNVLVDRVAYQKPPAKYYLQVQQRGITKNAFVYFQSVITQTQSNGTLFDVPAQTVLNPNVKSVSNPGETILGLFNLFSSRRKVIYIDMSQIIPGANENILPIMQAFSNPLVQAPCIEGIDRTQTKPFGWVD